MRRPTAVTSLIQSAKPNELEPWAYLKEVLTKLPTKLASRITALLPYHWTQPA